MCRYDIADSHLHFHNITKMDVEKDVHKLKSNKIDDGGRLFSNNCIHGTNLLNLYLSMLFNSMIDHDFAPGTFLHSTVLQIPKGAGANLFDSNINRSIAVSTLLSKRVDNIIIERQS